jgi:hypothetical protein
MFFRLLKRKKAAISPTTTTAAIAPPTIEPILGLGELDDETEGSEDCDDGIFSGAVPVEAGLEELEERHKESPADTRNGKLCFTEGGGVLLPIAVMT